MTNRWFSPLLTVLPLLGVLLSACEPKSGTAPSIAVTLNGIPSAMNELLVVPPSGFVVNVTVSLGSAAIDPTSLQVSGNRWGGANLPPLEGLFTATASGAAAVIPADMALETGTYTVYAFLSDVDGRIAMGSLSFAVRNFPGANPPIGTGQQVWLDFAADRDGIPGPDFLLDLQSFGLASAAAPGVATTVRGLVIDGVLARIDETYGPDASEISDDPVAVTFTDLPPGAGDVTRICVGGEDPSGGSTIGSVPIDINNANRNDVACGTIPPTGVFPRELLVFQNQSSFQAAFDPLRPERGGVPIGGDPWDAWVLNPGFDPENTLPELLDRYTVVMAGIEAFANALGSLVAHESAHALGLVPPGAPGLGLYGGSDGAAFTHSLNPDGSTPSGNLLMKAGNTFNFSKLAGLGSYGAPVFRELELAYLHDRVVLAPNVQQLLPPPSVSGITPNVLLTSSSLITITGEGFAAIPDVRLLLPGFAYSAPGETWLSPGQVTAWVVRSQLIPGLYDVQVTNPDGQKSVLPAAFWLP